MHEMKKSRYYKTGFVILVLIAAFVGYAAVDILSFRTKNQLVKTDAAIVLGAAVWGDQPSPVFKERINHAIWLYRNGYVHHLIFTGSRADPSQPAESEAARTYAISHQVSPADILIETKSRTTEENLQYAYAIATENGLHTFTIVSDPLHMKRSITIAEQVGMEVYASPTPTSAYKSLRTQLPFFLRELFFYTGYLLTLPFR
ncbi:YdcF family protein [Brevibacillus humidisoli]|uniref:YdcF family protein n=1 Tax=Brevibacillus humidisoli TaxID=2895522 RepID=UPI001E2F8361|nr:YdcF family protein [Brevibacillus humidisoli]UFJ41249.1 YdcF family protein [Brevibacillus humidisoli]